jgi:hypothetical protein
MRSRQVRRALEQGIPFGSPIPKSYFFTGHSVANVYSSRKGLQMFTAAGKGLEVPAVGAFCLGLFIGYLAWYFVVRFGEGKYTSDGLVAIVGVALGGVVIKFIDDAALAPRDRWWYPVGLVAAWILFTIIQLINWGVTKDKPSLPGATKAIPSLVAPKD